MQFVDEIKLKIKGGRGGDGVIRFEPDFGPSGGSGGRGGSVIFKATNNKSTLAHLTKNKLVFAGDGLKGKGSDGSKGRDGEDVIIEVPIGTVIKNDETKEILFDLSAKGNYIIARGGEGGKGNSMFVSNNNKSPRIYEYGLPGEEIEAFLEVRVLANCGIIGFPSVGKSSFIRIVSNAKPKIAAYNFTTLSPVIGVVTHKKKEIVLADLPGLIEGASEGKGLGDKFLKHALRCETLLHFIDASSLNYKDDYKAIWKELNNYSEEFKTKKEIVCISKSDLEVNQKELERLKKDKQDVILLSTHTHSNVKILLDRVIANTEEKKDEVVENEVAIIDLTPENKDTILVKKEDDAFVVCGEGATFMINRFPLDTDDNKLRFNWILEKKRVFKKLKKIGWTEEDDIIFPQNVIIEYYNGLYQPKAI